MQALSLGALDWLVIASYFLIVLGLGFYLKRYTTSQDDYFLAASRCPF